MDKSVKERLNELEKRVYIEEWTENLEHRIERIEQKRHERLNEDITINSLKNPIVLISILCAIGSIICTTLIFLSRMN